MYFVLKILKILFTLFRSTCFGHHCAHHQELLSCTCSLWSLWCLVRCVLQSCCFVTAVTTQQDWRTQRTKHHTGPETACAAEKLLMMDTMVSETCRDKEGK